MGHTQRTNIPVERIICTARHFLGFLESEGYKGQIQTMSKTLATKYVASVLVAFALILGFSLAFAQPAKADVLSDLQAQVAALMAQISSLQGSSAGSQQA